MRISKSWGILGLALALGGTAFFLTDRYLSAKEEKIRGSILNQLGATQTVVVATRDLRPGDVASAANMAIANVPVKHLSAAVIPPDRFDYANGKVIQQPMKRGEPLLTHMVAGNAIARFSDLLEEGHRAITLEVDDIGSNAGMLTAGDYVDVFALLDPKDSDSQLEGMSEEHGDVLYPVLQRVRILSVGPAPLLSRDQEFVDPRYLEEASGYATVTIGVPRDDAAKVILAKELGEIVFMLRYSKDKQLADDAPLDRRLLVADLVGPDSGRVVKIYAPSNSSDGFIVPKTEAVEALNGSGGKVLLRSKPIAQFSAVAPNKEKHGSQ